MNKDNRLYGIRDNGTVEGYYIETYYTPCKGIVTDIDNQLVRVVADNDATDIETRVLFSTLESDGWINPKEASILREQLAERVRTEGVRIDVSLLDADGTDYVPLVKELIAEHGTAPAALRFLLDFYRAKREDTSVHP